MLQRKKLVKCINLRRILLIDHSKIGVFITWHEDCLQNVEVRLIIQTYFIY